MGVGGMEKSRSFLPFLGTPPLLIWTWFEPGRLIQRPAVRWEGLWGTGPEARKTSARPERAGLGGGTASLAQGALLSQGKDNIVS